jgi:ectoine hydroxylase-related dioxygenase (phytanoyl-CoA dioxygenase family)
MNATNLLLPTLEEIDVLTEDNIQEFRRNGHTLTPGLLTEAELEVYREIIDNAATRYNNEKRKIEDRDTYGKAFLQIMNLWRVDEGVKKFVMAKRFGKIAASLLGVENVRIYHDQALFKEAGGGPTPWHQDQYYWPVDTTNTVTIWMPLVNIDIDMGMLTFASGSHTKGFALDCEISDESEEGYNKYIQDNKFPITRATRMSAGDATWHYGFTIHNAPGNKSNSIRKVMTIIYVADGARVTEPDNPWQKNDLKTWLDNKAVGELVNSPLNPLVL